MPTTDDAPHETFYGEITTPFSRGTLPRHRLEISHDQLRFGSPRRGLQTVHREDIEVLIIEWSRPWLLEQMSGLRLNSEFFAPVRLSRVQNALVAYGWPVTVGCMSRRKHRFALLVQYAVLVGFLIVATAVIT